MFGFGKKKFIEENRVSPENEKYLGFGAIMLSMNLVNPETMAIKKKPQFFSKGLPDAWSITDTETAKLTIEWLLTEGHRAKFNEAYIAFKNGNLSALPAQNADTYNSQQQVYTNYKLNVGEEVKHSRSLVAWDIERAAYLARICQHIGYITEQEAWNYIKMRIYPLAKQSFKTWPQYGVSFCEGRAFSWGGRPSDGPFGLTELLKKKTSIWLSYPLEKM